MKLQYCSDLHLEFPQNAAFLIDNPIIPTGEILILAGDIVLLKLMDRHREFFQYLSDHFETTYWIPGNHEFYHNDLKGRTGTFKESILSNVHLVNKTTVVHDNVQLILSTLWSKISPRKEKIIEYSLNDFRLIHDHGEWLSARRYNELFQENRQFIEDTLASTTSEKRVVVTHHVPTFQHYPPEYINCDLNEGFATNLDALIERSSIDYCIFGHHHRNMPDFEIAGTKMVTNQLGYVAHNEHLRLYGIR